jgi:hypothetical protein
MMQIKNDEKNTLANYQKHPDPLLNGNPLSESLQVILSKSEVLNRLKKDHPTISTFKDLPKFYQKTQVNHFRMVISPHPQSFFLYQKIMELILCGYIDRNPFSAANTQLRTTIAENAKGGVYNPDLNIAFGMTSAPSCLITGLSGSSKTTTARSVLSLIPQYIQHEQFEGRPFMRPQLTYISFDCAATSSPKALALSFFAAVDSVLNTKYFITWEKRTRDSVERFYANMQLVAAKHHIGLIHIDEVQFFLRYSSSKNSPNLIILESLFNKIGIPVILSCTLEGLDLFQPTQSGDISKLPDMTTTRRMISEREFVFGIYPLGSNEFNEIFDAFFPHDICVGGKPGDEFKKEFYRLSAGIPAIINRLARLHHEQIVTVNKKETDDVETLSQVYRSQFRHIDYALQQIRTSNTTEQPTSAQMARYEKQLPREEAGHADWNDISSSEKKSTKVEPQVPDMPEYGSRGTGDTPVSTDDDFDVGI